MKRGATSVVFSDKVVIRKIKATTRMNIGVTRIVFSCKVIVMKTKATTMMKRGVGSCKLKKVIAMKTKTT
jgi:hypothetical protein